MEIKITTSHLITFTVEAFWDEEGGMGHDEYGGPLNELKQAILLLELAQIAKEKTNWVIVAKVKKAIN